MTQQDAEAERSDTLSTIEQVNKHSTKFTRDSLVRLQIVHNVIKYIYLVVLSIALTGYARVFWPRYYERRSLTQSLGFLFVGACLFIAPYYMIDVLIAVHAYYKEIKEMFAPSY